MPPAPRKPRIKVGVIGLGIIGSRVAANLRAAGHQVYVWSRSPHRAPNFLGSVVEVADLSDVLQVFVGDDAALLEVTRTIAAALSPRHVFACHATVSPGAARQAASIIEGQGARYLDAPFTGSKAAAQNRQLVYYVGGGKEALEEARPVLEASSKTILHLGGIGDASVLKIATNMVTASTVQTLAEALALVRAAGVPGQKLAEALENNGSRSGTSDLKLPAMLAQNFEANFSLKHMLKDARLALDLADGLDLSLPVTETASEVFSLAMANGWADQDFCCVTQLYPTPEPPGGSGPAAETDAPAGEAAKSLPETPPEPPDVPAEPAKADGIPSDEAAPLSLGQTLESPGLPAAAQNRAGLKESTLRTLRGLFKSPVAKAKPAPAPPMENPGSTDTILPTDGLASEPLPAADCPSAPGIAEPPVSEEAKEAADPTLPLGQTAPMETAAPSPQPPPNPVLAPDR